MKLYITEKPSVAQDLAKVLGIVQRGNGEITVTGGDKVTFAVGHLLELAEPHEYNPDWKKFTWEHLPMIPPSWKLNVIDRTRAQFRVVQALIKQASEIVVATDPAKEGELIAREIIYYCGFKGKLSRLWFQSMTTDGIKEALRNLKTDEETKHLYVAAILRQRSDWIVGLSGTRACTLAFDKYKELYSMGRVQTPTLNMVVKREREIVNFIPVEFYKLEATVDPGSTYGEPFLMTHNPTEKITDKAKAQQLLDKAKNYRGPLKVIKTAESEKPGLPFDLPGLQSQANKRFKFTAKKTLKIAQQLYEKKFTTYPRTDYTHLFSKDKANVPKLMESLAVNYADLIQKLKAQGVVLRDSTYDDSKCGDHSGLAPTEIPAQGLDADEQKIYDLICLRFMQCIAQDCLFDKTVFELDANTVLFKTSGKAITRMGWKELTLGD